MNPFVFAVRRFLARPLFAVLLVVCAVAIFLAGMTVEVVHAPFAGVCDLSNGEQSRRITAYLLENGFVQCEDPDEMRAMVQRGELDCAVILPEDLVRRMETDGMEGCVQWIVSPSSFVPDLYKDHVASALFREYAPYLTARSFEGTVVTREELFQEYARMFAEGFVFSFEVSVAEKGCSPVDVKQRSMVMGTAAILLCAVLFAFGAELADASFRGILGRLGLKRVLAGVVLPGLFVGASLVVCAGCVGLLLAGMYELMPSLVIYGFLLAGAGLLLAAVLPGTRQMYILLAVLVICSAALCPIYTDLTLLSPALKAVRYLLPPYWLWLVEDSPLLWTVAAAFAWIGGVVTLGVRYGAIRKYSFSAARR